ncbi:unnamed protein product, partial [Durusdinium trenchii]
RERESVCGSSVLRSADLMDVPQLAPLRSVFWKMLPKLRGEPTLPIFSCGRYGASDFIGRHDDQALVPFFDDHTIYRRKVAAIWYLTKDWTETEGGCLVDLKEMKAMDAGELKRGPHLSFGAKTGDIWTRCPTGTASQQ